MPVSVRQSILWTIVGIFLAGNFTLAAALWRPMASEVMCMAASGALVAEPMLLAIWLGFGRQPILERLSSVVGLSVVGAAAYISGIILVDYVRKTGFEPGVAIAALFVVSGVGAALLAGGLFRAHRFVAGVLTVEDELAEQAPGLQEPVPQPGVPQDLARQALKGDEARSSEGSETAEVAPRAAPSLSSPFDDDSPKLSSAAAPAPTPRELQFGMGYIVAMTSIIAIMISTLRSVSLISSAPKWSIIFLFGWTFFFYSAFATLLVVLSILTTRYREVLAVLALVYTLVVPLAALAFVVNTGLHLFEPKYLINLYAYALSLTTTLALVALVLRRIGYRLRHGWL